MVESKPNKAVAVFCSGQDNIKLKYTNPAEHFISLLAQNKYDFVWGGSNKGMMGMMASAAKLAGCKIIGISLRHYEPNVKQDADEMTIVETLAERKTMMLEKSDAIIAFIGGLGTVDEITEIMELKRQKKHNKPLVVLNTDNFYAGAKALFKKMKNEGTIKDNLEELIYFAKTPEEAMDYINEKLK